MKDNAGSSGPGVKPAEAALVALLGTVWGSAFMFVELALETFPPITLAMTRLFVTSAVMYAVARVLGERVPLGLHAWLAFALIGLVGNAMPFTLISIGQVSIDSSLTAILMALGPLFTMALAHIFTGDDKASPRKSLGMLLGLVGVVMLIGPDALAGMDAALIGQICVVGASFSFAVNNLLARRVRGLPAIASTSAVMLCGGLWVVPLCLSLEQPLEAELSTRSVLAMLALAIFSSGLANVLFFRLLRTVKPSVVSLNSYVVPSVGVLWGVVLLGESLDWRQLAALAVILAGIAFATTGSRPARAAAPASGAGE